MQGGGAGIDGDGVLAVNLDRVQHAGEDEELNLHVGGLGKYHPQRDEQCHVHWRVPNVVELGDEITIRILPSGQYDDPSEVHPSPSAKIDDPVFGSISYNVSAWDGQVAFEFPLARTTHVRVHVGAPDSGPTQAQRDIFQEFLFRYKDLWPSVAEALSRCHRTLSSVDAVHAHLDPIIGLDLYESPPGQLELSYTFDLDTKWRQSYHVTIRDWQIVEVCCLD